MVKRIISAALVVLFYFSLSFSVFAAEYSTDIDQSRILFDTSEYETKSH